MTRALSLPVGRRWTRPGRPRPRPGQASRSRRSGRTPLRSSPSLPAATSAGRRWPASAGSSPSTAPSATAPSERTAAPRARSSGPALNGRGAFAAVPASPQSSAWHGDQRWDHAVGPLQFIPSTWETWGADGDGDGVADPNDLDDAAYAAARYLCADGHDLTTGSGWADAVFSYNHAQAYVDAVHAAATSYAERTG